MIIIQSFSLVGPLAHAPLLVGSEACFAGNFGVLRCVLVHSEACSGTDQHSESASSRCIFNLIFNTMTVRHLLDLPIYLLPCLSMT